MNRPSDKVMDAAVRKVVADESGRAVLQWILAVCDVDGPSSTSEAAFQYREAQRDLGRRLRRLIERNFDRHKVVDIEEEQHG